MPAIQPPPTRIFLFRHAEAAQTEPGRRDFDRVLTEAGYDAAEIVSEQMSDRGYRLDRILTSTAVRCRQTAEAVQRALGPEIDQNDVDALYNSTVDIYLELLETQKDVESVMLIGHNPIMEQALASLIGPAAMTSVLPSGFPTAGLAVVEFRQSWALVDFLRP